MGKVARFDSGDAAADATIDLGSDQAEIWVEFRIWSDEVAVAVQGQLILLVEPGFTASMSPGLGPVLVEFHYNDGVDFEFFQDGVLQYSFPAFYTGLVRNVSFPFTATTAAGVVWIDDVKIGTTRHGTDLFSDGFESGTFAAWTATSGDATIVDAETLVAVSGRVAIGFAANALDPDPVWTIIDTIRDSLVARYEIEDGRQTEQDETEPGRASVYLNDTTGLFDPNNPSSPYFGVLDGKPVRLQIWNPVDLEWVPQWRGIIDDIHTVLNPATSEGVSIVANVVIECVDIFDYLGRAEMQVGVSGNTVPPAKNVGTVFYEDGDVQVRIEQLLADAHVDPDMYVVFSGNVDVLETQYDPGDSFLPALREAADAEFPGIANVYVDKLGRFVFHGRFARLDPDGVIADGPVPVDVWDFNRWKAGDGAAIGSDPGNAQIREFSFGRPRDLLVNSATCYPEKEADGSEIDETKIPAQLTKDDASIDAYGIHGRTDDGLIVKGHKTNLDDGWDQCKKYADFWVAYYPQPLDRIERIVFKSVAPSDSRAAATWGLITGVSISDTVDVSVGYPGGVGFFEARHYVEGRRITVEPLQPIEQGGFDMVTVELNLSPAVEDTLGIFD